MVHLELIPNALEYGVLERCTSVTGLHLNKVVLAAHDTEHQVVLESNVLVAIAHLVRGTHVSDDLGEVIDLLLGNGFTVRDVKTVKVDHLLRVVVNVHLVEDLPSCVEVYLLHHFLELLVAYLFRSVFAFLVFFLYLLLKLIADLFVFCHDDIILGLKLIR